MGQIPELGNQEQVEPFLEDHWRLNVEETAKLLPEDSILDIESLQVGVPLFPYGFSFQGDKFEIPDSGVAAEFRFQSYDKESGGRRMCDARLLRHCKVPV